MAKQTEFDKKLVSLFGAKYAEIVRSNSLEYMIEKGISSGLKVGWNTEDIISHPLNLTSKDTYRDSEISIPHFIATLQCRELLAIIAENSDKQIALLEQVVKLANP